MKIIALNEYWQKCIANQNGWLPSCCAKCLGYIQGGTKSWGIIGAVGGGDAHSLASEASN